MHDVWNIAFFSDVNARSHSLPIEVVCEYDDYHSIELNGRAFQASDFLSRYYRLASNKKAPRGMPFCY
jgi:hypothetical protein